MTSHRKRQRSAHKMKRSAATTAWKRAVALLSTTCGVIPASSFPIVPCTRRRATNSVLIRQAGDGDDNLFVSPVDPLSTAKATTNATALFSETPPSSISTAGFGDVVRPRYLEKANFGSRPVPTEASAATLAVDNNNNNNNDEQQVADTIKRRNFAVALASVGVAILNYLWQFTHPLSPVQLLVSMQASSAPVSVIGSNGKPTVVDFWAPWCENCKLTAPTLRQVEEEYKDRVNFVMVDGDKRDSWDLIEAFGVDAIPHLALVSADGDVETALIGPIPKSVLEADLEVLISNAQLKENSPAQVIPYRMMDVFAQNPARRRVHFDP